MFMGDGTFTSPNTVEVGGKTLTFKKAVIATGGRPIALPIPGLKETGYLNNETVFSLTRQPKRLAVIGAGPIGCELAQAFQNLGSEVWLVEVMPQILGREDKDAAAIIEKRFREEGMHLVTGADIEKVSKEGDEKVISLKGADAIHVDEILVGVGRAPNVEGMGLEAAGVEFDPRTGVKVTDTLRTTNKRIFAVGDVCLPYKFTHTADFSARAVIQNALFGGKKKFSALTVPWCTYTHPEIAHVGLYEHDARKDGVELATYVRNFKDVDRAICETDEEGFVKIHTKKGTDDIVGATIVGPHAGDLISEVSVAMVNGIGLGKIANVIHPYPTRAEAIRQVGDMYNRTRLTPFVAKLFKKWFSWTR
jgi:pyruvate/2-oxoglutarate dehydrogenase complex dihydrolipoamide dehydrogenase (E3) component